MYWTALRENRVEWPSVPDWSWRVAIVSLAIFAVARMFTQGIL